MILLLILGVVVAVLAAVYVWHQHGSASK